MAERSATNSFVGRNRAGTDRDIVVVQTLSDAVAAGTFIREIDTLRAARSQRILKRTAALASMKSDSLPPPIDRYTHVPEIGATVSRSTGAGAWADAAERGGRTDAAANANFNVFIC